MMDIHEFHRALGTSLDALDRASEAEERVKNAERMFANKQTEISALADAHEKLKEDSDNHLAANQAKMAAETATHNNEMVELKQRIAALQELHRKQSESAGNAIGHLHEQLGKARQDLDTMNIERERRKNEAIEYARHLSGG